MPLEPGPTGIARRRSRIGRRRKASRITSCRGEFSGNEPAGAIRTIPPPWHDRLPESRGRIGAIMPRTKKGNTAPTLRVRLRVYRGDEVALGPGKASLLAAIAETGSLAHPSRPLGMSYMRAWSLLQTMDRCFREPVV